MDPDFRRGGKGGARGVQGGSKEARGAGSGRGWLSPVELPPVFQGGPRPLGLETLWRHLYLVHGLFLSLMCVMLMGVRRRPPRVTACGNGAPCRAVCGPRPVPGGWCARTARGPWPVPGAPATGRVHCAAPPMTHGPLHSTACGAVRRAAPRMARGLSLAPAAPRRGSGWPARPVPGAPAMGRAHCTAPPTWPAACPCSVTKHMAE